MTQRETESVLVHSPLGFSEGPQGQCGGNTLAPIKLSFLLFVPLGLLGKKSHEEQDPHHKIFEDIE